MSSKRFDVTFAAGQDHCAAWLYLPAHATPEPGPVLVIGHGLGAVREMRLDAYAERFCAAGYACLVFDYRGFGASGGQPRQVLDIERELEDWAAAIAYVRSRAEIDPQRVILWGSSFGGGNVIVAAARDQQVAAVVAQCPLTDGVASALATDKLASIKIGVQGVIDLVGSRFGRSPLLIPICGPPHSSAVMSSPDAQDGYMALLPAGLAYNDKVAARLALNILRYRPGRATTKVNCPIMFCICERDSVAPAGPSQRYASRAPQGEVHLYPFGHFDIYLGEPFELALADQLAFLFRHVPPAIAA